MLTRTKLQAFVQQSLAIYGTLYRKGLYKSAKVQRHRRELSCAQLSPYRGEVVIPLALLTTHLHSEGLSSLQALHRVSNIKYCIRFSIRRFNPKKIIDAARATPSRSADSAQGTHSSRGTVMHRMYVTPETRSEDMGGCLDKHDENDTAILFVEVPWVKNTAAFG